MSANLGAPKTRESKAIGSRYRENRRGRRMNSRVPVRLEWDAAAGPRITVEHRLALTNLATESSNAAVVVWKGSPRPDGWEYGIELVAPEMDFWGLEL